MKTLKDRIADVSMCLQSLTVPKIFPKVQDAVERKDKDSLIKVCREAEVPETYLGTVIAILLSVSPQQKWPPGF
jgi:hypothetical protein